MLVGEDPAVLSAANTAFHQHAFTTEESSMDQVLTVFDYQREQVDDMTTVASGEVWTNSSRNA